MELAAARARYTEEHPSVTRLKAEIAATEQEQADIKSAEKTEGAGLPATPYVLRLREMLQSAESDLKVLKAEEQRLREAIAAYQTRLENTPKREQELAVLTRDYDTTRDLFKSLLAKRGEAGMASELEQRQKGESFRVIEPARLPERPAGPNRFRLLLVGLALALGASAAAVVLAEQVDTSFRRVDEVRSTLPMPVLSAIPRITTEHDRSRTLRQRRWATAAVGFGLFIVAGTSFVLAHDNQGLVALLMQPSAQTPATSGR